MEQNGIGLSQLRGGTHIIRDLFLKLADGERKYQRAITLITKPLCDGLDEAEKQVPDTKQLLSLPNADGLVIILNERVTLAGPSLIMERLGQRLAKTDAVVRRIIGTSTTSCTSAKSTPPATRATISTFAFRIPSFRDRMRLPFSYSGSWKRGHPSTDRLLRWPGPNTKGC